jgi:PAS domain-containing protein
MKQICSWCGIQIRGETGKVDDQSGLSHGICDSCVHELRLDSPGKIKALLDKLNNPVLSLDENLHIISANTAALELLETDVEKVAGNLQGDALECVFSFLPGGCGHTKACDSCSIRETVIDTQESGEPAIQKETYLYKQEGNGAIKTKLTLSTEQNDDVTLVRFDQLNKVTDMSKTDAMDDILKMCDEAEMDDSESPRKNGNSIKKKK